MALALVVALGLLLAGHPIEKLTLWGDDESCSHQQSLVTMASVSMANFPRTELETCFQALETLEWSRSFVLISFVVVGQP